MSNTPSRAHPLSEESSTMTGLRGRVVVSSKSLLSRGVIKRAAAAVVAAYAAALAGIFFFSVSKYASTRTSGPNAAEIMNGAEAKTLGRQIQPNPFSVRDYYPDKTVLPAWIEDYIEFHNKAVVFDEEANKTRLADGVKFLVYSCRGICGGVGDRTNGMITLFYAALLSRRVLIIDHPRPFHLKDVLLPNRIRWDVDKYPSPQRQYSVIDKVAKPIPFLKEPCQSDTEVHGILIRVNQWYMRYLWPSKCMQDLLVALNTSAHDTDCSACNIVNDENGHQTYRWAFWTLFKFSSDVINEAIRLRIQARLDTIELDTVNNTAGSADLFRPYIAVHIRHERHHGEEKERMFLTCAHKFQERIRQRREHTSNIVVISDHSSMKEKFRSWDNATVKVSTTEEFHTDSARSWATARDKKRANLDVFAELLILIESECLVRSRSGYSEIPQMVAISNQHTNERCGVRFDECSDEAVESAVSSLDWNWENASIGNANWSSWVRFGKWS